MTTYIVRLLDDGSDPRRRADDLAALFSFGGGNHGPPPIRPLVVYRVANGKETLVRGVTLENLLPRSFKEVAATGNEPVVYNYHGRRRRLLGGPLDHRRARVAVSGRRRPAPDGQAPQAAGLSVAAGAAAPRRRRTASIAVARSRHDRVSYFARHGAHALLGRRRRGADSRARADLHRRAAAARGAARHRGQAGARRREDEPRGAAGERRRLDRRAAREGAVPRILRGAVRRDRTGARAGRRGEGHRAGAGRFSGATPRRGDPAVLAAGREDDRLLARRSSPGSRAAVPIDDDVARAPQPLD